MRIKLAMIPFLVALAGAVYLSVVYVWWIGIAIMGFGFLMGYVKHRYT